MRYILFLSLFLLPQIGYSQFVEKTSIYISPTKSLQEGSLQLEIHPERFISSVSLSIHEQNSFEGSFISTITDTFMLTNDEHGAIPGVKISNLIIFPEQVNSFMFHHSKIKDSVHLFLINDQAEYSGWDKSINKERQKLSTNYEMPKMIDQSFWRVGLPEPDFERIVHEVHNVIVHHSATSNLVTDYYTAVRNIYLYHTEVRGWSDIGYNYVIVGNGDIYKGRDPATNEQDLVMGAHFCASNRGTMGICMLGTFTEVAPTDTASDSLEKLLVWKLGKDNMDPLGQYAHPLDEDLYVISGHRDGCATECPGEIMYTRLGLMRDRVHNKILILGIDLRSEKNFKDDIHFYPNPLEQQLFVSSPDLIKSISILTIEGKLVKQITGPVKQIDFSNIESGSYILTIATGGKNYSRQIIKR